MATFGVAEEDWELVADEFAATVGEDRRTAGETCALLLAALGRRAPESEAVRQHVKNDRGAAPAGRVVNRERHRMERLEVLQRGQVLAVRLVGRGKQTNHDQWNGQSEP